MAEDGFVVVAIREDDRWRVDPLPSSLLGDLEGLLHVLRQQPGGGAIGLASVADDFFVAARVGPADDVRLLLSDGTAAEEWDLARQVLVRLGEDLPDDDDVDEVWPVGDLAIFADLGMSEMELGTLLDELDLYPDEMLLDVAHRLGFTDAYQAALGSVPR